jgi:hypothetical protein
MVVNYSTLFSFAIRHYSKKQKIPCYKVVDSTDLLQVVPTTCYRPGIQQFVSDNLAL